MDLLSQDSNSLLDFQVLDNKLYFKNRLVILDNISLKEKLLSESHDSLSAGHGGYLKTEKRISSNFFWPGMKHDVRIFVHNCLTCQQNKYRALALVDLLQPLPVPERIWEDISLDFIVGLPKSDGCDTHLGGSGSPQ